MTFEWIGLAYYGLSAAAILATPGAWAFRVCMSRIAKVEKEKTELEHAFNEYRIQASEKFASAAAINRLESKIDTMSDRINGTLLDIFKGKPKA
ncbi:MAG TPA: hypothetical protein VKQ30_20905 [Ktedonobacterales bacterium]|nr:hypothetical protein [Ktedonobacterales bacterium]